VLARVTLTGTNQVGPVVVWIAHVTSVFARNRLGDSPGWTEVHVAGAKYPHAVTETVERVLELIDAAEAGLGDLLA
jgi:hypothetical protein